MPPKVKKAVSEKTRKARIAKAERKAPNTGQLAPNDLPSQNDPPSQNPPKKHVRFEVEDGEGIEGTERVYER
jgi:hypothetical protein